MSAHIRGMSNRIATVALIAAALAIGIFNPVFNGLSMFALGLPGPGLVHRNRPAAAAPDQSLTP
ncbi:hypothetical protein [Crystallibacter crystallopoietes]|uniref:hypothetical protein n=1 Tax=Crystallibacter crystallopoietes TaxID=37928 RepID=UPI0002DA64DC|nr:hypothetical protein [Arthrobacter crystallopoietes]